jgi:hypothetical protein
MTITRKELVKCFFLALADVVVFLVVASAAMIIFGAL